MLNLFLAAGGISEYFDTLNRNRVDSTAYGSLRFIIWPVILGIILSFFIAYYRRRVIGAFVRSIRSAEAVDEESAKSLTELGQENNASAIAALQKSQVLRRIIHICGESEEIDGDTRVYIPEEKLADARAQYGDEAEPIYPILIGSVVLIALGVVLVLFVL